MRFQLAMVCSLYPLFRILSRSSPLFVLHSSAVGCAAYETFCKKTPETDTQLSACRLRICNPSPDVAVKPAPRLISPFIAFDPSLQMAVVSLVTKGADKKKLYKGQTDTAQYVTGIS